MSRATAAFADAMESCAGYVQLSFNHPIYLSRIPGTAKTHKYFRMKGPSYEQGTRMQAAAGLHYLMANHWHVLVRR